MVRGVKNVEDRTPSDLLEIDNDDDNALRLMVIVPWELPGTWGEWRELFPQGPVRISIFRRPTAFDGTSRRLREPVRRRLLDPDSPASLHLPGPGAGLRHREEPHESGQTAVLRLRLGHSRGGAGRGPRRRGRRDDG